MSKVSITKDDLRYMVSEAVDKLPNGLDGIIPDGNDADDNDEKDDEQMKLFYDTIENLAVDGIMCFHRIRDMLTEDEYGKENAERLKKTLEKITDICDKLEDFINDSGRD